MENIKKMIKCNRCNSSKYVSHVHLNFYYCPCCLNYFRYKETMQEDIQKSRIDHIFQDICEALMKEKIDSNNWHLLSKLINCYRMHYKFLEDEDGRIN